MAAWKRLSSGKYVDLLNLTKDDVDLGDITTSLNMTYRFNGHHKDAAPLTVAQHSLLCLNIANKLWGEIDPLLRTAILIHDFGEAYYGDISTPVKQAMGEAYRKVTDPIDAVINEEFYGSADIDPEHEHLVKVCDIMSLDIERRMLWSSTRGKDYWPLAPHKFGREVSEKLFLEVMYRDVDFGEIL